MAIGMAVEQTRRERQAHQAFEALMRALAKPGTLARLPEPGLPGLADSLLDLEVGFFTANPALDRRLAQTGARRVPADAADYLFFPRLDDHALDTATQANKGDPLYPDRAATLFIEADIGSGGGLNLFGPGIRGVRETRLGGITPAFWEKRRAACRYPLGWDVFFVDGVHILGLPRSTEVEVL